MRRIALIFLSAAACTEAPQTNASTCSAIEPAITDSPVMKPELAFATRNPASGRIEIGTFEPGVTVVAGTESPLTIVVGPEGNPGLEYRVRDAQAARNEAVCAPIPGGAGSVPNDLVIAGPTHAPYGVLVRSGDNAVSAFDLERGLEAGLAGVRLPDTEDACGRQTANPWFATALGGDRVAVTAYGQARTYVLDMNQGTIETTLELSEKTTLETPQTTPKPIDADCDGTRESEISRFKPRTPQPITKAGDHLLVGYTNFYSASPPIYLPGLLAIWTLSDLTAPPKTLLLPNHNPQELRALDDHRVLLVCTGVLDQREGTTIATTPGAVLIINAATATIEQHYDLGDFAPGTAILAGGSLWVGSLIKARLRKINPESTTDLDLNDEEVDSIFRLIELPGSLLGVPTFDGDRLFILDPLRGILSPPPFYGPIQIGPGRPIFDGLSILARRPGRAGIDFVGPDLYALSAIASRVTPIELRKVLGP